MSTSSTVASAVFYPEVLYADADAGIEWLQRVTGCEPGDVHRDEAGTVVHAELSLGGAVLMVATAGSGREPFRSMPAGAALVYVAIDDPDALHARAVAAGAEVAVPLSDTDYGSRDFTLRDPEGNLWAFGSYRPTAG